MPFFSTFMPAYVEMTYERDPLAELLGLAPTSAAAPVRHPMARQASVRPLHQQRSCMDNFASYMHDLNMHDYDDDEDEVVYYHPFHGLVKQPSLRQLRPQLPRAPIQRRPQQAPQQQKRPAAAPQPQQTQATPSTAMITMRAVENQNDYTVTASLPGFDRRDVSLSFSDPQTLVVSGRLVERKAVSVPAAAPVVGEEKKQEEEGPKPKKVKKYQATVEEDTDEDDYSVVSTPSASSRRSSTLSEASSGAFSNIVEEPQEESKKEEPKQEQPKQETKEGEKVLGEFSRMVRFPCPVDTAKVEAAFNDAGQMLTVKVPKLPKFETQQISVF